ncbi:hypothetical protein BDC45DRAFT_445846, partial [Circinella umbellata]
QVKKLYLTHLPLLDPKDLEQGLHKTFAPYGHILDVGINRDPKTKAYMVYSFAVLEIQPYHQQKNKTLDHHILWCNDTDNLIYAHFDQMPLYCS